MGDQFTSWSDWADAAPPLPPGTAQLDGWYELAHAWLRAAPSSSVGGERESVRFAIAELHAYWRSLNEVQQRSVDVLGVALGGSIATVAASVAFGPAVLVVMPIYNVAVALYAAKIKAENDRRVAMVTTIREAVSGLILKIERRA